MKTSLKKLQKFAVLRQHDKGGARKLRQQSQALDELARATQDMNDMKDCYDRLLSAALAIANSVYEFSESIKEMGDCLLEKTALSDDEDSGKVLLMLGKTQLELQKLIDGYRSHIVRTITIPSESLLKELCIVEEMKGRCDDKREIYEDLLKKQKEKGRLKNSKGEIYPSHELQEAHNEYDEEANIFVFRMKSLKQGQSHSLLTQASRHHAAQLSFFKKALRSLEAIEPHVRLVAQQQHIDYQFSGLKADEDQIYDDESESDTDYDTENGSETNDHRDLSFEYRQNGPVKEVSTFRNSMELDNPNPSVAPGSKFGDAREPFPSSLGRNSLSFLEELRHVSKSAPLFPNKRVESADQVTPKFTSYVLPTPDEMKTPNTRKSHSGAPQTRQSPLNPWHSSPLAQRKLEKLQTNENLSGPIILDSQSVLRESNNYSKSIPLPPPSSEGLSYKQLDPSIESYAKKAKRQAFSGPITGKPLPNSPNFSDSNPHIASTAAYPIAFSGSLLRTPLPRPTSIPKSSSRGGSSPFVSAPIISELHELPRPPPHLDSRMTSTRYTQSGPIMTRNHKQSNTTIFSTMSTLPMPPQALPRTYSIPAGSPMGVALSKNSQLLEVADSSPHRDDQAVIQ